MTDLQIEGRMELKQGFPDDGPIAVIVHPKAVRVDTGHQAFDGRKAFFFEAMPGKDELPRPLRKGDAVIGRLPPAHAANLKGRGIDVWEIEFTQSGKLVLAAYA